MFCDRCGRQISGNEVFCASCGRQVNAAPVRPISSALGRVQRHLSMLATFWLIYSLIRLASGYFVSRWWGWWGPHFPFLPLVFHGIGMIAMAVGIAGLATGWGLHERQPWARSLAIGMGILVLFNLGLGTVLGIYSLWVLLPAQSEQEYRSSARAI